MEFKRIKKSTRSKSKGRKKAKKKIEPFISKYPAIDYEKAKSIPLITVLIKFEQAKSDFHTIEYKFPSNMILKNLFDKINERHCNSCRNLKIYMIVNSQKKYLNDHMYKAFGDLKISPLENFYLIYEYEPVESPILEAGLV